MSWRILHLLDHSIPLHSGYSFRTRAILQAQRALGWETVHLTGPKQGDCEGCERESVGGFEFLRTRPIRQQRLLPVVEHMRVVRAIERRLDEAVTELEPDIIHAHSPPLNGLAATRVARRRGLPCVYEVRAFWEDAAVDHGTTREGSARYRLSHALETHVLKRADAVTCICEGLREEILGRGLLPAKVTVIPNAVNAGQFTWQPEPDAELADSLATRGKVVLGFIGSFYAYEGLDILLRALANLRERHPDVVVLLVGGGPQEQRLRAIATAEGLEDVVRFTGRVPHEDVSRYYSLVDIFVYPRRSMRLTELVTPLKPLEAMAHGKLVIASNVGGHRELIRDGDTGVLFDAGSPEALAEGVDRLLSARESWPDLRRKGREFVERERSWAASVGRYQGVYEAALESCVSRGGVRRWA